MSYDPKTIICPLCASSISKSERESHIKICSERLALPIPPKKNTLRKKPRFSKEYRVDSPRTKTKGEKYLPSIKNNDLKKNRFRYRVLINKKIRWMEEIKGQQGAYLLSWNGKKLVRIQFFESLSLKRLEIEKTIQIHKKEGPTLCIKYASKKDIEQQEKRKKKQQAKQKRVEKKNKKNAYLDPGAQQTREICKKFLGAGYSTKKSSRKYEVFQGEKGYGESIHTYRG